MEPDDTPSSASDGPLTSPREFMRARRPHLYSDSVTAPGFSLSRDLLEFQLAKVTAHKKEAEFEHFCRRIAERVICPNLRGQTGPTGGGDSKADAESFPVADAVALRWYSGTPREASTEQWAFAVSAKERWKPKVRSDVEGIVGTKRSYARIYFLTNQHARDKARAELEDELRQKHGLPVHILDIGWLLDQVFSHRLEDVAVSTLGLDVAPRPGRVLGSRDARREADLAALKLRIEDPTLEIDSHQLALDAAEAAYLARCLERPQSEVLGLFDLALSHARRAGAAETQYRVTYSKAWTLFWWHEDYGAAVAAFEAMMSSLPAAENASDLELASNLLSVLTSRPEVASLPGWLSTQRASLEAALRFAANNRSRPNNALYAQSTLALLELQDAIRARESPQPALERFAELLKKGERLAEYPVRQFADTVIDLGDEIGDVEGYDALFDVAREILGRLDGVRRDGLLRYRRAVQKRTAGKIPEALEELAHARVALAGDDSREPFAASLLLAGHCYEQLELLFAARGEYLYALHHLMIPLQREGRLHVFAVRACARLAWLDLTIGHILSAMLWWELGALLTSAVRPEDDWPAEEREQEAATFDLILGQRMLEATIEQLAAMTALPAELERRGFWFAAAVLLYALGHPDEALSRGLDDWVNEGESLDDFAVRLAEQPSARQMRGPLVIHHRPSEVYETVFLGCRVVLEVASELPAILVAGQILTALEAFSATLSLDTLPFVKAEVRLQLRIGDDSTPHPPARISGEELSTTGESTIVVAPDLLQAASADGDQTLGEWVWEVVTIVLSVGLISLERLGGEAELERIRMSSSRAIAIGTTVVVFSAGGPDAGLPASWARTTRFWFPAEVPSVGPCYRSEASACADGS